MAPRPPRGRAGADNGTCPSPPSGAREPGSWTCCGSPRGSPGTRPGRSVTGSSPRRPGGRSQRPRSSLGRSRRRCGGWPGRTRSRARRHGRMRRRGAARSRSSWPRRAGRRRRSPSGSALTGRDGPALLSAGEARSGFAGVGSAAGHRVGVPLGDEHGDCPADGADREPGFPGDVLD